MFERLYICLEDRPLNTINKDNICIGDATKLPYKAQSFDLLVCFRFLPWIVSFGDLKIILNEFSRVCKKYAIIENEFGEIGIDDSILKKNIYKDNEMIIEMNNGCLCCKLNTNLIDIFTKISEKKNDPKTPEMVLFGLIFVNFFHLKTLPKT